MPKKQAGENSKKVAGNAKKAEAAAQKQAVDNSKKATQEDQEWNKGAKSSAKKEDADAKKAAAAAKKAERDALLAAEEATARSAPKNTKTAVKKTNRGLDLSQLDDSNNNNNTNNPTTSLNATGIDNALDALALTSSSNNEQVDRHPERRFKAAYAAYEARRLPEIEKEYQGLRKQQRVEIVKKEFEKSEENPFNKVFMAHDAGKEEMREVREAERRKAEERLGGR